MKMKRIFAILLLVCIATGAAYAQESKNSLTIDFFPFMKGLVMWDSDNDLSCFFTAVGFDHLIAPSHTIGGIVDLYYASYSDTPIVYFGASFSYKYFTMSSSPEKAYVGGTLGIGRLSVDGKSDSDYGGFMGFTAGLTAGYRIVLSKIFLEPSLSYVLGKSSGLSEIQGTPLGWQGGFKLGFNL